VRRLTELLEQPTRICGTLHPLPVWHCSIHNHPDDPTLSDQQWEHVATEITAAVGLAPPGDLSAVRWVGIRHADNHIHIIATLARQDRRAIWAWNDYRNVQARCRTMEQRHELQCVEHRRGTPRHPTGAELNKANRRNRSEAPRHHLQRLVWAAADRAGGEHDLLDRLHASGLLVRPRTGTGQPGGQLSGYAVALPDDHNAAGDTIWYGGARLAADLTLPKLRRRWPAP
jgi:hypothetical protein